MGKNELKDKMLELATKQMLAFGLPFRSVIRDCMTELLHIADDNSFDIDDLIVGATEVFEEEKEADAV